MIESFHWERVCISTAQFSTTKRVKHSLRNNDENNEESYEKVYGEGYGKRKGATVKIVKKATRKTEGDCERGYGDYEARKENKDCFGGGYDGGHEGGHDGDHEEVYERIFSDWKIFYLETTIFEFMALTVLPLFTGYRQEV